jgi:CHAT domain-containing protein
LIELDGALTALTLIDGRLARHELGGLAAVDEELQWLTFALQRLTQPAHSDAQRRTAIDGARASAGALQRTLLSPLQDAVGDRPVVLVPTGALHAVPWPLLPAMHGRPLCIAPSLSSWLALQAPRPPRRRRRIVVVAGPRVRHARDEAARVADLHHGVVALTGAAATVAAVARALDGAALAHLACHGRFRADSPLFSSLELADGRLNAYDLQRLRRSPEVVILSACDLAVSDAQPGDELLGFAAALIAAGTRTIIASVLPAPDAPTKRLMIALHQRMLGGEGPAAALAGAQARLATSAPALGGFMCLGSG